ncbi:conserved hypothetical protein [Verticillium alfalfae VaMs.102]|uniref:Siderophore iron transporter mirB n=1 Tax=Verticillium alfalfae (strain VaMs.102 / ATCC MYA-4576 / FGSC 10136) TaxID=526221 RepID=C9SKP4_VERA1|nr:conserved hypothetical protein [Verticillium alfalfae VaMs.102]EEY19262.1 conserved hypothetical protein [Verticillium alfalfae VaMs.102]
MIHFAGRTRDWVHCHVPDLHVDRRRHLHPRHADRRAGGGGPQHVAAALAMLFVSGGMGGSVGSTISGAIWTNTFLPALRRYLPEGVDALVVYGDIVAQLSYPVGSPERLAIQQAYGYAQTRMLAAGTGIAGVLIVWICMLKDLNVGEMKQTKGVVF